MKIYGYYLVGIFGLLSGFPIFAANYDATIQFANRSALSIPVSGQIKLVNVKSGQRVKAGEVMVALDKTPFEVGLAQAEAGVIAKTTLEQEANRDLEQAQELYDRGVLSTVELENAKNKHIRANAALKSAQAQLRQAKYNLVHAEVIAPANGWVLKVQAKANESINSAVSLKPLVIYAEENKYIAKVSVPLKALRSLNIGNTGSVTIGGNKFRGTVLSISLESETINKDVYIVEVIFTSNKTVYRGGQSAKVDL